MEEEYNQLRCRFGTSRGADQLPFADFCALDEISVGEMLQNVESFVTRGRLAKLRKDANQLASSSHAVFPNYTMNATNSSAFFAPPKV